MQKSLHTTLYGEPEFMQPTGTTSRICYNNEDDDTVIGHQLWLLK